ncbi:hypothetical protein M514_15326 [Trichuris suis]|uniref:Uncharacterized protein n=1 Tax=Trichuris suis TaxID=68888 RepID=A0A085NSP4_9BILA|nr:hypothetical protein M514_15326 [Trichuris suis]
MKTRRKDYSLIETDKENEVQVEEAKSENGFTERTCHAEQARTTEERKRKEGLTSEEPEGSHEERREEAPRARRAVERGRKKKARPTYFLRSMGQKRYDLRPREGEYASLA